MDENINQTQTVIPPIQPDKSSPKKLIILIVISVLGAALLIFLLVILFIPRIKNQAAPLINQKVNKDARFTPKQNQNIGTASATPLVTPTPIPTTAADTPNTLPNPTKETTIDQNHYLIVGLPKGQNNKPVKKVIFSLPGHGSTAEQDYEAWKKHVVSKGDYALVSINWWDGKGESPNNYYSPSKIVEVIDNYLSKNNYQTGDLVILEGFSRGSANTYSVVANDRMLKKNLIDGVISASGKYQSDFAMTEELLNYNQGKPYSGVYWILACGQKDPNPTRDGCEGMTETQTFLESKGAQILAFLKDPNGAHGAFHMSPLNLPLKALEAFDEKL